MSISCVMLTTASRTELRQCAIRCFLRQMQAPERELIIASEDDLSAEILSNRSNYEWHRIRFVQTPRGLSLPEKRNAALEHAQYPWITFWDDDDWSSKLRLHETARAVARYDGATLVGQPWIYFHELRGDRRNLYVYRYPHLDYVVGGPMAFHRTVWQKHPFRAYETGGDEGWWTMDRIKEGHRVGKTEILYMAMLHGDNAQNREMPRVAPTGKVLSDSYMMLLGGRETAFGIAGAELVRFEAAVK